MFIINLTQHNATKDQKADNVRDIPESLKPELREALTFDAPPESGEMSRRALDIHEIITKAIMADDVLQGHWGVMIGGAPFFMPTLQRVLEEKGQNVYYAFSQRVSEEDPETGIKVSKFKHMGLIPAE